MKCHSLLFLLAFSTGAISLAAAEKKAIAVSLDKNTVSDTVEAASLGDTTPRPSEDDESVSSSFAALADIYLERNLSLAGYLSIFPENLKGSTVRASSPEADGGTSTNSNSKGGKEGKGGKASTTSHHTKPPTHSSKAKASKMFPYYVGPFSCPQQCLSGATTDDGILESNNVKQCDANDKNQEWYIHDTGPFVKIEVAANLGYCLGVSQEGGLLGFGDDEMGTYDVALKDPVQEAAEAYLVGTKKAELKKNMDETFIAYECDLFEEVGFNDGWDPDEVMCNTKLQLVDCTSPATNWYWTGAHYISSLCWSKGYDAVMQVSHDCSHLEVTSSASGADDVPITASQTFMLVEAGSGFIESIVPVPKPSSAPSSESTSESTPTDSTASPSPSPGPVQASLPVLQWKGVNGCTPDSPCNVCTGDCDSNEGCMPGLECFKRSGSEPVPGCISGAGGLGLGDVPGGDYCYDPSSTVVPASPTPTISPSPTSSPLQSSLPVLEWKGVNGCTPTSPCDICQSDCDENEDCLNDLECFKRTDGESTQVPGCAVGGSGDIAGADYCYDPTSQG